MPPSNPLQSDYSRFRRMLLAEWLRPETVFALPSRSAQALRAAAGQDFFHRILHGKAHSIAPAPCSYLALARPQFLKKFCDQIAHHGRPISRGRSNVIDRPNLRDRGFPRQSQQRRIDSPFLSAVVLFPPNEAAPAQHFPTRCGRLRLRRQRSRPSRRDADFGNGLRVARSDFAGIGKMFGKSPRQANRSNQFIRRKFRLLVTGMKVLVRHPPLAANGHQNEFSLVRQQRGQGIRGRRCIDDVAAERAAILVRNAAGPGRSMGQQRKLTLHNLMLAQIGVGASGADANFVRQRLQYAAALEDSRC